MCIWYDWYYRCGHYMGFYFYSRGSYTRPNPCDPATDLANGNITQLIHEVDFLCGECAADEIPTPESL
jgi:hypothetical protein